MFHSADAALAKVRELGFPRIFVDILTGKSPPALAGTCDFPRTFFDLSGSAAIR